MLLPWMKQTRPVLRNVCIATAVTWQRLLTATAGAAAAVLFMLLSVHSIIRGVVHPLVFHASL
jgi:hypothetical protein